ncbi:MAG TPA: restriction endonuclease subunit S [Thermodesulfobacteriota bacterium]|nr:restriction endonuclease subunit S [Thermodesulfobacteriota bacterium]
MNIEKVEQEVVVSSRWTTKKLEEILAEPVRNGIYKKKKFHGHGQKIINMGELFAYDFISDQEMKRVELSQEELQKSTVKDGDLLFARRSFVLEGSGKCSLVVHPSENTTFESSIIRVRLDKNKAEPKFYHYLFRSPLGRALIASIATRTAVSGITGGNLVQLRVPNPPIDTQRKIASILSAYDDLIENNTRRIQILEEMAQVIYKEWFIHFRFPGHEKVKMVESELGVIPEGWEVKRFSDIVELSREGINPGNFEHEMFCHFSLPAFDEGCMPVLEQGATIRSNKYLISENSVLLSKLNPRISRVWLPLLDSNYRAVASTEFLVLMPKQPVNRTFLFTLCQSSEFLSEFAKRALGTSTSHQRVKPDDFFNLTTLNLLFTFPDST